VVYPEPQTECIAGSRGLVEEDAGDDYGSCAERERGGPAGG